MWGCVNRVLLNPPPPIKLGGGVGKNLKGKETRSVILIPRSCVRMNKRTLLLGYSTLVLSTVACSNNMHTESHFVHEIRLYEYSMICHLYP